MKITSGSMSPEIETGEIIIIKKSKEYKVGDIVTYIVENKFLVTHRIIGISSNKVTTKGDSNNISDEEILISDIQGKVILHSIILGYIYRYRLLIFIILFIFLLIIR